MKELKEGNIEKKKQASQQYLEVVEQQIIWKYFWVLKYYCSKLQFTSY
jgi:hypothetical protein